MAGGIKLTYEIIKEVFEKKGYAFFDKGTFNLNIGAIRMEISTNKFDDIFFVAYRNSSGISILETFDCSTDPGSYWLKHLMNEDGCFIMKPGQYRGAYTPGPHGSTKYRALRQCKEIPGYRDKNKDSIHDMDESSVQTGIFWTNIHHGWNARYVEKNSAGCQVLRYKKSLARVLELVDLSIPFWGDKFTYTLLEKEDFKISRN